MRAFFVLCALLLAFVQTSSAAEVIRQFVSDVTVNSDGSLDVREQITVNAEGNQIRRGILRDFPTDYTDRNGNRVRVGFDVVAVERNGNPENFTTKSIANGVRIQIGDADVFLPSGEHTYVIVYRTNRQIGFFQDYDELYWNATGTGWTFPIEQAITIIRLPQSASIKQYSTYTGRFGSQTSTARVLEASGNRFSADVRGLGTGEGLTVAVAWQKGIVTPPTEAQQRAWWLRDNLGFFAAGLTLLGVMAYYLFAWTRVGRDPPKGTVIPLFHPPEGMGPAGVRYVWQQGFDDRAFAAGIVGLAVKKRLRISEYGGGYAVEKLGDQGPALTRAESAMFGQLPSRKIELKKANHASVGAARLALSDALEDEYDGTMFLRNFWWFVTGAALSIVGLLAAAILTPAGDGTTVWVMILFSALWWSVILAVGYGTVKGVFSSGSLLTKIKSLMGLIFLVPFVGAGLIVPAGVLMGEDLTPKMITLIVIAVLLLLTNLIFYWLLKAPTLKGRGVMDRIEGFRLYMATAEEERLKILHPPEKTPELFQQYLPYAMALECENEWNKKFATVLAAAAAAGAATSPYWYSGSHWNSDSFSTDLGSGLTSSLASSSTPPGSSSGSSGGGFSGGGGGGGGGSGW